VNYHFFHSDLGSLRAHDALMPREIVYHIDNPQARAPDNFHNVPGVALPHFHD
jgi:hypothetical protein